MTVRPALALICAVAVTASGCAGLDRVDQGNLQPQAVSGPCQVKKFFLVNFTAMPTDMTVAGGSTCGITVLNPDLQLFVNAALVTERPAHGVATASVTNNGFSAIAGYTPQPGYTGTDVFSLTLEPNDRAIRVHVTVQPG